MILDLHFKAPSVAQFRAELAAFIAQIGGTLPDEGNTVFVRGLRIDIDVIDDLVQVPGVYAENGAEITPPVFLGVHVNLTISAQYPHQKRSPPIRAFRERIVNKFATYEERKHPYRTERKYRRSPDGVMLIQPKPTTPFRVRA